MPLSANFRRKTGATSGQEPLLLLEILHPQLVPTVRIVRDVEDLVHLGNVYSARGFEVAWPDDVAGKPPRSPLQIDNTKPDLAQWLDGSNGGKGATVRIIAVMRDTPDVVEDEFTCDLLRAKQDGPFITGELGYEDMLNTPALAMSFRPDTCPGIF